jgi:hypothetical protein
MMASSWRAARCSWRELGKSITNEDDEDDDDDDNDDDTVLPMPLPLPLVLLSRFDAADKEEAEVPLPPISSRAHSGTPWRCARIHSRKSQAAVLNGTAIDSGQCLMVQPMLRASGGAIRKEKENQLLIKIQLKKKHSEINQCMGNTSNLTSTPHTLRRHSTIAVTAASASRRRGPCIHNDQCGQQTLLGGGQISDETKIDATYRGVETAFSNISLK